jgi:hypothetical protein
MSRRSPVALVALALGAATVLAACAGRAAPALSDPRAIVDGALDAVGQARSVHLEVEVTGSLAAGLGGQATDLGGQPTDLGGQPTDLGGQPTGGSLDLEGTTAEADVDLAAGNVRGSFAAPALPGLGGQLIAIDRVAYLRVDLLGPRYRRLAGGDGGLLDALVDPRRAISELRRALEDLPDPPRMGPDEACGDADCYRVTIPVPVSGLAGALAVGPGRAAGSPAAGGAEGTGGTIDLWVRTSDLRPARLVVTADGGSQGRLTITVQLTRWDEPVSISAPPADQVDEGAPPSLGP